MNRLEDFLNSNKGELLIRMRLDSGDTHSYIFHNTPILKTSQDIPKNSIIIYGDKNTETFINNESRKSKAEIIISLDEINSLIFESFCESRTNTPKNFRYEILFSYDKEKISQFRKEAFAN